MDTKKGLEIINLLELNPDSITIDDVKSTTYDDLKEFLALFDKEKRLEIREKCKWKNRVPSWLSIQRNLNPIYNEERQVIWVWITHYIKETIKELQIEAGVYHEKEENPNLGITEKFGLQKI